MNEYIMPANAKKSGLILGLFNAIDLNFLGVGMTVTAALLLLFNDSGLLFMLLAVLPGIISALLVFPIPNYHNVMQFIVNVFTFFSGRRKYEWKGWVRPNEK